MVRLPRISNGTDVEALAAEPGVAVRLTANPAEVAAADLVVLPGSKSTVADLDWLRATGLADAVVAHARAGRPLVGICGGYQMMGRRIHDPVESGRGTVDGLGLLPVEVTFRPEKTLGRQTGRYGTAGGAGAGIHQVEAVDVAGYEIHHGEAVVDPGVTPLLVRADGRPEGVRVGNVFGTHWHGTFESDDFRRAVLVEAARLAGRRGYVPGPDVDFRALRGRALDTLADLVEEHLDTGALWRLIESGAPPGLAFIPPGAPGLSRGS